MVQHQRGDAGGCGDVREPGQECAAESWLYKFRDARFAAGAAAFSGNGVSAISVRGVQRAEPSDPGGAGQPAGPDDLWADHVGERAESVAVWLKTGVLGSGR